jgi:Peptidase inhibitor family I36
MQMIKALVRTALMACVASALALAPVAGHAADLRSDRASAPTVVPQATVNGCPSGWYCFYVDANFGGRVLQFSDCGIHDLRDFGFNNGISSWVNNTASSVDVFNARGALLWHEPPHSKSSFVGSAANDQAAIVRRNC